MSRAETNIETAARLGYAWREWLALTHVQRAEIEYADTGQDFTAAARAAFALYDLPVGDRLAAFHAGLSAR